MSKTIIALVTVSLLLLGCQRFITPITNVSDRVSQTVETERQNQENRAQAIVKCQERCQQQLLTDGQDFDIGPCLSNAIAPDWVCDVAHEPRQAVDDDPANQCAAFRAGTAKHFVEIDGNCNVIDIY